MYNKDFDAIHETVLKDIIDVISDFKDSDKLPGFFNKKSIKSITRSTEGLTLVFPVLTTKTLTIENASMISKALERKIVGMLQMLFSAISITDAKDAFDYISKFHSNLKIGGDFTIDQFIDDLDRFVVDHESAGHEIVVDKEKYKTVLEDMKNISHYLPVNISEQSLNDYKVSSIASGKTIIQEAKKNKYKIGMIQTNNYGGGISVGRSNNRSSETDRAQILKNYSDAIKNQILSSDVQKANELVATNMIINFVTTGAGDEPIEMSNVVIGVKAKLYLIDSEDIINRIISKNKDRNGFLSFIRATTREISFWRDFVFAIDKAKIDAISSSGRGSSSRIWKLLERRALKSRIKRSIGMTNDSTAITTLVVSQEEVEYLKKNEHIDLEKPALARGIMESYNLMGIVIVDEASEIAKFIFDTGDDVYETLSFNRLERETSDSGYKKVINLMTKMSR